MSWIKSINTSSDSWATKPNKKTVNSTVTSSAKSTTADKLGSDPTPSEISLGLQSSGHPLAGKSGTATQQPTFAQMATTGIQNPFAAKQLAGQIAVSAKLAQAADVPQTTLTQAEAQDIADNYIGESPFGAVEALADEIAHLDEASTDRVIRAIVDGDSLATELWLNAESINNEVAINRISPESRAQIVESFARNYIGDDVTAQDYQNAVNFTGAAIPTPPRSPEKTAEYYQETLELLGSSDSTEVQLFRQIFGKDLLEHSVSDDLRGNHANYASALGLEILEGSGNPNILAHTFGSFSAEDRHSIMQQATRSDSQHSYGSRGLDALLNGLAKVGSDATIHETSDANGDGFPEIVNQNTAGDLAVEAAEFISGLPESVFFDRKHRPRAERADAVGNLFATHAEAILDAFGSSELAIEPGDGNTLGDNNKEALGTLLRLTALNPDNAHYDQASSALSQYIDKQTSLIAELQGTDSRSVEQNDQLRQAIDKVKLVGKALGNGVQQARDGFQQDREQREALIDLTVGTIVDLLPVSRLIGLDAFKKKLSESTDLAPHLITKLADKLFKEGVNLGKDELGDLLKSTLTDDQALLLELTGESNLALAIISDSLRDNNVSGDTQSDILGEIAGDIDDD